MKYYHHLTESRIFFSFIWRMFKIILYSSSYIFCSQMFKYYLKSSRFCTWTNNERTKKKKVRTEREKKSRENRMFMSVEITISWDKHGTQIERIEERWIPKIPLTKIFESDLNEEENLIHIILVIKMKDENDDHDQEW